jgi:cell division protein ZapE
MPGVLAHYHRLVAAGQLRADGDQLAAATKLDALQMALQAVPPKGSIIWRMLGNKPPAARGLYLWGGVGRGKSMLMDVFFDALSIQRKRRAHFHSFMQDAEVRCLCFDEMIINNAADAMIMARLFTALIAAGVTLVTTSNRPPDDLYKDGLNREHFLPFIALIVQQLDVLSLNGPTDYRLDRLGGVDMWHSPLGAAATQACRDAFFRLTDFDPEDAANVPTTQIDLGTSGPAARTLHVPKSLKGVAVFSFKRLCQEARGAADYLAIARAYHTVFIVGIPIMGPESRNEAARFITLIDALYEHKVKLIAAAAAEPDALYPAGDDSNGGKFEFDRTVSRLIEMQSAQYLALGHGQN